MMKNRGFISMALFVCFLIILPGFRNVEIEKRNEGIGIQDAEMLFNMHPKTLSRDIVKPDKLAQDGKLIGFIMEGDIWIFDPADLSTKKLEESDQLDWVQEFNWQGNSSSIKMVGLKDGKVESKIISLNGEEGLGIEIPGSMNEVKAVGQETYAFVFWDPEKDEGGLFLKTKEMEKPELVLPEVYPFTFAFNSDASQLAYLHAKNDSELALSLFSVADKSSKVLANNLDGSEISRIGFAADNKHILISLVSGEPVMPVEKHAPFGDRDFDIYAVNIDDGSISSVLVQEGDDILLAVDGDKLYWNITKPLLKTVLVSADEGIISPLITEQTFMAYWHPKGKELSVVYGDWRMADYPLNWDIGKVKVNGSGKVTEGLTPLVTGYHEDFGMSWSPDGKWIAYQSRRTESPSMFYGTGSRTDGIFVRAAEGGDEIKVTDFCKEAWMPDWSPDGKQLVFCASSTESDQITPWLVQIDENGKAKETTELKIDAIGENVWCAAWSPTEDLIALESCNGSKTKSIWLVDSKGENAKKLTSFDCLTIISGLDFTPDGKEIVFSAFIGNNHQLHKIPVKGGKVEKITDNSYDLILPQVSPDGKWIATTIFRNTKQLWSADITL